MVPDRHHNVPPPRVSPEWIIGSRIWHSDLHIVGHEAMFPVDLEVEPVLLVSLRIALLEPHMSDDQDVTASLQRLR